MKNGITKSNAVEPRCITILPNDAPRNPEPAPEGKAPEAVDTKIERIDNEESGYDMQRPETSQKVIVPKTGNLLPQNTALQKSAKTVEFNTNRQLQRPPPDPITKGQTSSPPAVAGKKIAFNPSNVLTSFTVKTVKVGRNSTKIVIPPKTTPAKKAGETSQAKLIMPKRNLHLEKTKQAQIQKLSAEQKYEIYMYKMHNPDTSFSDMAKIFSTKFQVGLILMTFFIVSNFIRRNFNLLTFLFFLTGISRADERFFMN